MHKLCLILAVLFATIEPVIAATINVASFGDGTASRSNALAAINAASAGDTVVFPLNGSATWSTSIPVSKALIIDGNGTTLTAGAAGSDGLFHITGFTSNSLMRVTGFTFNLVNFNLREPAVKVSDNISLGNLRIDHNTFHFGYEQIGVGGAKGVIDHNYFYNSRKAISFNAGSVAQANASWESMAAGTGDALFVEDNHFIDDANYPVTYGQEKIGTFNGGKLVIRYNEFDFDNVANLSGTATTILTHGSAAGGTPGGYWQIGTGARRGQSVVEIYNNNMHGPRIDFLCSLRGSANLIFNNTLDTQTNNPRVSCYEEEQYETSNWSPLRTAWPAEDQVHNTFVWNNTLRLNGVPNVNYFEVNPNSTLYIQENRDYFLHAPQATGGREVFTGANGASSSYPTDGITFPTQGTMVFVSTGPNAYYGYTPYTYPHPLTLTPAQPTTTASVKIFIP